MSISAATALSALPKIVKYAKSAIEKDSRVAYGLKEPWVLPRISMDSGLALADYEDDRFRIEDRVITVKPYACDRKNCDGCTWAPEKIGEFKAGIGSVFHDPWYHSMAGMAAAWGVAESEVRRTGDVVFGSILLAEANRLENPFARFCGRLAARTYFTGVRAFGGIAHAVCKSLAVALATTMLAGCSGCAVPRAFEGDDDYKPPVCEMTVDSEQTVAE